MRIKRLIVEEGFLDGLDLAFEDGLNVLIGARGVGKTSIIELIRYALQLDNVDGSQSRSSANHAESVLGSGIVHLVVELNGEERQITRAVGAPPLPSGIRRSDSPLVFSQREIEKIGQSPRSRLRLLDGFVDRPSTPDQGGIAAKIISLTKEIATRLDEIDGLRDSLSSSEYFSQELSRLRAEQNEQAKASTDLVQKREIADQFSQNFSAKKAEIAELDNLEEIAAYTSHELEKITAFWTDNGYGQVEKVAKELSQKFDEVFQRLAAVATASQMLHAATSEQFEEAEEELRIIDQNSRQLRSEIEEVSAGSGKVAAAIQTAEAELARLANIEKQLEARKISLENYRAERAGLLDQLEASWQEQFDHRLQKARNLTQEFAPLIEVKVIQFGQEEAYAAWIANLLQGSGIRYTDLSRKIAANVSPRELAEWAEGYEIDAFAEAVDIPSDRAAKCLSAIDRSELGSLLVLRVEDDVEFYLQDKSKNKPIDELSTGQRCTIVLPILLSQVGRTLILDQPEDHIDNAFIVSTLIKSMRYHALTDQLIVASHNANIPVLGEASMVAQLESTGERGFVKVRGGLDERPVVEAVTSVMEGGIEAFEARAKFYHGE